jgi:hypothetical protein
MFEDIVTVKRNAQSRKVMLHKGNNDLRMVAVWALSRASASGGRAVCDVKGSRS